ncbi:hypothetical protein [Legionella massiliensis]|nr:hypothetical protein [Legionella massiliensis]
MSIAELETRIKLAKSKQQTDKQYFKNLCKQHQFLLTAMLIPAFLIGWRSGKNSRGKYIGQPIVDYGLLGLYKLFNKYSKLL